MEQKRKIIPPVYVAMSIIAIILLHFFLPIVPVIPPPYSYGGAVLLIGGIAMSAKAANSFRRAGTPVVPFERSTTLVTTGFYRFTRNPMYLGMVIGLSGLAILFGTLGAFLPIPAFVVIIQEWFIKGEERFLEEIFGAQYLELKGRVRRWL